MAGLSRSSGEQETAPPPTASVSSQPRKVSPSGQPILDLEGLMDRILARSQDSDRLIVGLAGPPGVGKSTVAREIADRIAWSDDWGLGPVIVPMDGFHLADDVLDRLGRRDHKGAPDTFDGDGFVAMMRRIRAQRRGDAPIWCPRFDRTHELAVAGSIEVRSEHRLILVEGNYLLLDHEPWRALAPLFDCSVHLDLDPDVRVDRLVRRHRAHGRTQAEAERFVARSDEVNARRIEADRHRADLILTRP